MQRAAARLRLRGHRQRSLQEDLRGAALEHGPRLRFRRRLNRIIARRRLPGPGPRRRRSATRRKSDQAPRRILERLPDRPHRDRCRPLVLRQDHHHHQDQREAARRPASGSGPSTSTTTSSTSRSIPSDEFGDYDYETPAGARPRADQRAPRPSCWTGETDPDARTTTSRRASGRWTSTSCGWEERDPADRQPARPVRRHDAGMSPPRTKFRLYIETLGQFRDDGRHVHALGRQPAAAPHDPGQAAPQPAADRDADPLALRAAQRTEAHHPVHQDTPTSSSTAPCPTSCRS